MTNAAGKLPATNRFNKEPAFKALYFIAGLYCAYLTNFLPHHYKSVAKKFEPCYNQI